MDVYHKRKKLVLLSYICKDAIRYDRITEKSAHHPKTNAFFLPYLYQSNE